MSKGNKAKADETEIHLPARGGKDIPTATQQKRLRESHGHSFELVAEVALKLHDSRKPLKRGDIMRSRALVRRALDWLDNVREAYEALKNEREKVDARHREVEKRDEALSRLPDPVPFDQAVKFITRQPKERARTNFATLLLGTLGYFRDITTESQARKLREHWQKNHIPRKQVRELRNLYESTWQRIKSEQQRAKAKQRKLRGPDVKKVAPFVTEAADKLAKGHKKRLLDALRDEGATLDRGDAFTANVDNPRSW